jgi:DNA-binding FadR family transcriptional regulator
MPYSRTAAVADALLAFVVDGTYPPGGALPSEADLATRFEVSRLTVREAIRSLASINVIEVRQGKSSVVNAPEKWSPLDPRLLLARGRISGQFMLLPRKLVEARRSVEVGIAELAATRRTEEHLGQLSYHLDAMRQAHRQGHVARFADADDAFHDTLFASVDNIFFTAFFESLTHLQRSMGWTTTASVSRTREQSIDWHGRILGAVAEGDPDLSRETMRAHS